MPRTTLFVGGLGRNVAYDDLKAEFRKYVLGEREREGARERKRGREGAREGEGE